MTDEPSNYAPECAALDTCHVCATTLVGREAEWGTCDGCKLTAHAGCVYGLDGKVYCLPCLNEAERKLKNHLIPSQRA